MESIPFNKPYLTGKELTYMQDAVHKGKLSGNGIFTKQCQSWFTQKYGFGKCLLTSSCTDALEMAALLLNVQQGDEIIVPSYTFVSTALAFVRQGARIVFADSYPDQPNVDPSQIEALITSKTKAIVVVHYAGVACDMDAIKRIANPKGIPIIEDAAQAIDSYYNGVPLGSIGALSAFSFHETKNIIAGEGGMLVANQSEYFRRAEIIWEKGTNRAEFFRGEVNKYGWVDTGSSFLPSEITAAFLYAQLENVQEIQAKRLALWGRYYQNLKALEDVGKLRLPIIPPYATNNAHMFYVVCQSVQERDELVQTLKKNNILAVTHYISLHSSPYYVAKHDGRKLPNTDAFTDRLLRLPLFYELSTQQVDFISTLIRAYFHE